MESMAESIMKSPKPNQTLCQVFMEKQNKYRSKIESATLADAQEWSSSGEEMMWAIEFLGGFSVLEILGVVDELEAKLQSLLREQA